MRKIIAALLLFTMNQTLFAQEGEEAGRKLLDSISGFDESLCGTYYLGIYLNKAKSVGSVQITVEKASEEDGATYKCMTTMKMNLGGELFERMQIIFLDEKLSVVRFNEKKKEPDGESSKTTSSRYSKVDGNWVRAFKLNGKEGKTSLKVTGPNYGHIQSQFLLMKILKLDKPAVYSLPAIQWPSAEEIVEADDPKAPSMGKLTLKLDGKLVPDTHRGKNKETYKIKVDEGDNFTTWTLSPTNEIYSIESKGKPGALISGTADTFTDDLKKTKESSPAKAVKVYLEVLSKITDVEDLDKVMDWETVGKEFGGLDAEMAAEQFKSSLKKTDAAFPKTKIPWIMAMLETKIEGDTATITMPGATSFFTLRKTEKGWLITKFPK